MTASEIDVFYPEDQAAWRAWLQKHHQAKNAVWVVFHKKHSGKPTLSWSDAVDVALCFGWIDSKKISLGDGSSHQFFSKRKPNGTWSKINKGKVARLTAEGLMAEAGLRAIAAAKENGSWALLDTVEELTVPDDLAEELKTKAGAEDFFMSLSKSSKKMLLQWVALAKRPETRQKRITEIAALAAEGLKPIQFR